MINIKKVLETLGIIVLLMLFLSFTSPNKISLPLIVIPYMLGALVLYMTISMILDIMFHNTVKFSKLRLYSLITTAVLINFALLKSIGQITLQDGLISLAIMVVSIIYISKFSFNS